MSQSVSLSERPNRDKLKPLKECATLGEAFRTEEFMVRIRESAPSHVKPERMLRTFIQATSKSPDLLKCSMRSVLGAMLTCSSLGLEPNTPLNHAYLIPFKGREKNPTTGKWDVEVVNLQLIFGYPGLLDLSYRSEMFKGVNAQVVFQTDTFSFEYGTDAHVRHKPTGKHKDNEDPIWAYAHAQLSGGQMFEVMPWSDVLRIRNRSQAYRSALVAKEQADTKGWNPPKAWTEAPWIKDPYPMGRKTAFRALSKWLPKSAELAAAVAMDERQDEASVDFGPVLDGADFTENELPGVDIDKPGDPGAAFGQRTNDDGDKGSEGKQQQTQTATSAGSQATTTASSQEKTPAGGTAKKEQTVQAFEGWWADEYGESTQVEPISDPVAYAKKIEGMWRDSDNRSALIENNRDGMEEAAACSQEAAKIVASIMGEEGSKKPFPLIQVQESQRGGWKTYHDAIAASLDPDSGDNVTPGRFDEWANIQAPGIRRAPLQHKMPIIRTILGYAERHNIEVPQVIREAVPKKKTEDGDAGANQADGAASTETATSQQQPADTASADAGGQTAQGETKPDPEAARIKAADEAAEGFVVGFVKELGETKDPAAYLGNRAIQATLERLKAYPEKRRRALAACIVPKVLAAIQEIANDYPKFHDDVTAYSVMNG